MKRVKKVIPAEPEVVEQLVDEKPGSDQALADPNKAVREQLAREALSVLTAEEVQRRSNNAHHSERAVPMGRKL